MTWNSELKSLLACPGCGQAPLTAGPDGGACLHCRTDFPSIGTVPWLFPEPRAALLEWRGRLHLLAEHLAREAGVFEADLALPDLHPLTRQRLEMLAAAHRDHAARLRELLAPLGLRERGERYEVHLALRTQLPTSQGLSTYYANLHRDWAWGDDENAQSLELLTSVIEGRLGRTLVLGAGAGRLAYDLHQSLDAPLTVALDFNPLLALAGARISAGEVLQLYEFPIAPRRLADHAVLRTLSAPGPSRPGLEFVLGDALAAPFAPGSFDTVVTPWFIDIVPDELPALMARINQLLTPGGRWIDFGSLAFSDRRPASCYSLDELEALVPTAGFELGPVQEAEIPYMRSPASRHSRVERVIAFAATKQADVPVAAAPAVPDWLTRADVPVPALPEFREQALSTRVYAFIMAMIDGERTVADMAALMEQQQLMKADDAVASIQRFLRRMHEDAGKRANF